MNVARLAILPALPLISPLILVTGAGGFVGRALVDALAADGQQVRALSRSASADLWSTPLVSTVRADVLDRHVLEQALDGVTAVVHLAGALDGSPKHLRRINVDLTATLAHAARSAGVSLVVHCSSAGVYGDGDTWTPRTELATPTPRTSYEQTKLDGERALRDTLGDAVPWIILRPAGAYGAGRPATRAFYSQVARRRVWPHGPTTQLVHPTASEDVVSAIRSALDRPHLAGRVFNIGGERALPFTDLIALIAHHWGRLLFQPRLPPITARVARTLAAAGVAPTFMQRLAREVVNRTVDTGAARDALGFRPVQLDETVAGVVAILGRQVSQ